MLSIQATNSDLADLPVAVLEDELAALASHLAAGMYRWLELLHEGGYRARVLADGRIGFENRWGGPIPDVPRPPPGSLERLLQDHRHLEIDADTCQSGENEPMDLNYAVDALLEIAGQRG